jgi:hypothetical protein
MNGLNELNNARNLSNLDDLGKIGHEDNPWKLGNNSAQENVPNWGNGTMDWQKKMNNQKTLDNGWTHKISMD